MRTLAFRTYLAAVRDKEHGGEVVSEGMVTAYLCPDCPHVHLQIQIGDAVAARPIIAVAYLEPDVAAALGQCLLDPPTSEGVQQYVQQQGIKVIREDPDGG